MRKVLEALHTHKGKIFFTTGVVLIVLFLASMHGLLPGTLKADGGALAVRFTTYGAIECASHSLEDLLKLKCSSLGSDTVAFRSPTDSPFIFLAALIVTITHLSVEYAHDLVAVGILTAALIGAYFLNRKFGMKRYIALAFAAIFLLMPIVLSMQPFGGTYWGIMLLPAAMCFTWWSWNILNKPRRWWEYAFLTTAWIFVATTMLFLDGYAFFMNAAAAGVLWVAWSWQRWKKAYVWAGAAMFTVGHLAAYLMYMRLFSDAGARSDMGLFRSMGLDLITLFTPSSELWWPSWVGVDSNGVLRNLWGDGSNVAYNFVGFTIMILSVVTIFYLVKHKKMNRLTTGLIIIGVMAFVMSLGPVLKINAVREPVSWPITYQSYIMPEEEGVVSLPTSILYEEVPGLSSMRATYRWHAVTTLSLVILAGLAVNRMSRKHSKVATILLMVACVEIMPNPFEVVKENTVAASQITQFDAQVKTPLKSQLNINDRILYYPNAGNDYLASYLTPMVNVRSYNLGNDKAVARVSATWPAEVNKLLLSGVNTLSVNEQEKLLSSILQNRQATAVVVPYFDLRWDSYAWPPRTDAAAIKAQNLLKQVEKNPDMSVTKSEFFSVVRVKE